MSAIARMCVLNSPRPRLTSSSQTSSPDSSCCSFVSLPSESEASARRFESGLKFVHRRRSPSPRPSSPSYLVLEHNPVDDVGIGMACSLSAHDSSRVEIHDVSKSKQRLHRPHSRGWPSARERTHDGERKDAIRRGNASIDSEDLQ